MAFYKRRVVVQDTPEMIREREVRARVTEQIGLEVKSRYPDLGKRAYTVEELNEMLEWQAARMTALQHRYMQQGQPQ